MNNELYQQIIKLLDKSERILLLTHARADADGLGAMISAYLILKELGKNVTAATNDPTPDSLGFLPAIDTVQNSLASSQDFIITLDCSKTPLNKIKYNLEDNRVNIIVSPKAGAFSPENVTFNHGSDKFDLIMTFDTGNLEHLGPIYDNNTEMFFETPLINIDHHASNTDFGQVNLVDTVAASATEVFYGLLLEMEKHYDKKLINEDIATLLLAGIITDTGSFQHANTSPRSMETAAQLLDLGARQQEIIKNIYKTKKLSTLKLWGIVLSKVQVDPVHRMVWSTIDQNDLREAGADSEETGSIIDDLLSNAPGAEVIFLIKENEGNMTSVSMRSTSNSVDVGQLCADMGGGGHVRAAGFKVRDGRAFDQVVSEVISKVRDFQKNRLNIHDEAAPKTDSPKENVPMEADATVVEPAIAPTEPEAKEDSAHDEVTQETYLDFDVKKAKSNKTAESSAESVDTDDAPVQKKRRRKRKRKRSSAKVNEQIQAVSEAVETTSAPVSDEPIVEEVATPVPTPEAAPELSSPVEPVTEDTVTMPEPQPVDAPAETPAPEPVVQEPVAPVPAVAEEAAPTPVPEPAVVSEAKAPVEPAVTQAPPSEPTITSEIPAEPAPVEAPAPAVEPTPAPETPAEPAAQSPDVPDWLKSE